MELALVMELTIPPPVAYVQFNFNCDKQDEQADEKVVAENGNAMSLLV
jgi:hypothetical protein